MTPLTDEQLHEAMTTISPEMVEQVRQRDIADALEILTHEGHCPACRISHALLARLIEHAKRAKPSRQGS